MKLPDHFQHPGPSVDYYDRRPFGPVLDGDINFYLTEARKTRGPVLDLACGTGRVALPLAQAGLDLTGLELSPHMLAIASAKQKAAALPNLKFVRGNMSRFHLNRCFTFIFIAFRAFHHLLTAKDQRACLECIRRHLRPGGRVAIHLFDPRLDKCCPPTHPAVDKRPTTHDRVNNERIHLKVTDRQLDPLAQTFSETWRWTITRNGKVMKTHNDVLHLRWTYRYEMRYLLELTGFRIVAQYSNFKKSPPKYAAEQIWLAEAI